MSKENRVPDERLAELFEAAEAGMSRPAGILGALSGHVIVPPSDLKALAEELQSLRSKPVAGATLSSAIQGLKIVLDAHDEEVRYQASIEGEAAEFWDDIEVKVDDVRVVLAALGAQVSAPTLEPASPQPEAVINEAMAERVWLAVLDCPHTITGQEIILRHAVEKEGRNATNQLRERITAALKEA